MDRIANLAESKQDSVPDAFQEVRNELSSASIGKDTSAKPQDEKAPPVPSIEQKREQYEQDARKQILSMDSIGPVKPGQDYIDVARDFAKSNQTGWTDAEIKQRADNLKTINKTDKPVAGQMLLTETPEGMQKQLDEAMKSFDNDLKEFDRPAKQIEDRFETKDILKAFDTAKEQHLPLIVQVGAYWCPHCQKMAGEILPEFEGTETKAGSMQKQAIFLHLDGPASKFLNGDAATKANELMKDLEGYPTFKVYLPGGDYVKPAAQQTGEMSRAEFLNFLKSAGIKQIPAN